MYSVLYALQRAVMLILIIITCVSTGLTDAVLYPKLSCLLKGGTFVNETSESCTNIPKTEAECDAVGGEYGEFCLGRE